MSWGYPIIRDLTLFLGYNLEYVTVGFGLPGSVGGVFSPGSLPRRCGRSSMRSAPTGAWPISQR